LQLVIYVHLLSEEFHSSDNNVWVCGEYECETVSSPRQIPNIKAKQIAAGHGHTIIIDLENNVWAFGDNRYGQLGLSDYDYRYNFTQINNFEAKQVSTGKNYTILIDYTNNVWTFGDNRY